MNRGEMAWIADGRRLWVKSKKGDRFGTASLAGQDRDSWAAPVLGGRRNGGRPKSCMIAKVILLGYAAFYSMACYGQNDLPPEEALSVLETLSSQVLENYSALASFEAEYAIEDTTIVKEKMLETLGYEIPSAPGPWRRRDTGIVKVRFDAIKDSVYTEIEMQKCLLDQDANGESMDFPFPLTDPQRAIVTPSHYYYFPYNMKFADFREVPAIKGKIGRAAFRKVIEEAGRQRRGSVVDPRKFFGYRDRFWKELDDVANALRLDMEGKLEKPAGATGPVISVRRVGAGDTEEYRVALKLWGSLEGSGERPMQFVMRFSKPVGYNCTSYGIINEKGVDVEMNGWDYEEIKGVFIPSKMSRLVLDPETNKPKSKRVLELRSYRVNEGIAEADISVAALGLENGDRVLDHVEEVCYEYENGQLVHPVSFDAPPETVASAATAEGPNGSPSFTVILVVNVVGITLLLALVYWRRIRKS